MLRLACLAALLLCLSPALRAQDAPGSPPTAPATSSARAAASVPAGSAGQPEEAVRRIRVEDDNARIDELHVRGQVTRIEVQSKLGGRAYEVVPANRGRDLSSDSARGAAGQSVWHFLSF